MLLNCWGDEPHPRAGGNTQRASLWALLEALSTRRHSPWVFQDGETEAQSPDGLAATQSQCRRLGPKSPTPMHPMLHGENDLRYLVLIAATLAKPCLTAPIPCAVLQSLGHAATLCRKLSSLLRVLSEVSVPSCQGS